MQKNIREPMLVFYNEVKVRGSVRFGKGSMTYFYCSLISQKQAKVVTGWQFHKYKAPSDAL